MHIDIKLVEAFAVIVRSGSLSKAESQFDISKATLSRQLQRLEEQLGVQLLVRSSRRVIPTEAGRAFYSHCEALLTEITARIEAASTELQEMNTGGRGRLCILSDNQFTTTFVSHVTRIFLELFPNIECELHVGGRADSPSVEEADCYVCAEAPDLPNVVGKLVGRLGYGLYASPAYVQRHGMPASPTDLAEHASIRIRENPAPGTTVLHCGDESHAYSARPALHTNDYWVMKTFCIDGLGIALLPDFFAHPEVKHGSLVPVLPGWKPERRRVYCAYQRQRYMGKKLRTYIDLISKSITEIDSFNTYVASSTAVLRKP
ncbi:LysR family transcriptional regulator [Azohydromonas australica]|uniref:LysR family transcriptional regulator n=1 Tax=Azohydromonas australica TaxID=364039 RepID=UPI0006843A6E|nr:LysR family transcriptional regulator [Azohydromonas australica]